MPLTHKALLLLLTLLIVSQSAYNTKVAKTLAHLSSIAYESAKTIEAWNCKECGAIKVSNVKVHSNSGGDLQWIDGFLVDQNAIFVSFRGSSNIQNWITNLNTGMSSYSKCSNCKVHSGFLNAWNLAKSMVINEIQNLKALHRDAPIFITGHSLGGALATLAAVDVHQTYGLNSLITFGEPRVGNQQFSDFFKPVVTNYRVTHYADIVPHIPLTAQGFYHEGDEVWYNSAMSSYQICAYGESSKCSNSLLPTSYNTGDHSMSTYLKLPASFYEQIQLTIIDKIDQVKQKISGVLEEQHLAINQE